MSPELARKAVGQRGSVTGIWRLTGERVVCSANFVVELPNGHLSDVHRTHEHDSLAMVFAEVVVAAQRCRLETR